MQRLVIILASGWLSFSAFAMPIDHQLLNTDQPTSSIALNAPPVDEEEVEEFDPSAPDALETLAAFDQAYRVQTGEDTMGDLQNPFFGLVQKGGGCVRANCHIFANVVKNERPQMLYLYIDGVLNTSWKVSTAKAGHTTPNFDGHPSGPFYPGRYMSKKYPGGDYKGLGNMPYASFYNGGFAIHGTPSIGALGTPASHGCVRSHPNNAHYFSELVRASGSEGAWVTVSQQRVSPGGALTLLP